MSNVYVIGDLHFGHKNVTRFRTEFDSSAEHDEVLCDRWRQTVSDRDLVYVLGDAAFDEAGLWRIRDLPGRKRLVRGNHDCLSTCLYMCVFEEIYGLLHKKRVWLSHAPVHPDELRGRLCVHGHVHRNTLQRSTGEYAMTPDDRYFNASAEMIDYTPYNFADLPHFPGADNAAV